MTDPRDSETGPGRNLPADERQRQEGDAEPVVIPIVDEALHVDVHKVQRDTVRVTKTVESRTERVSVPLLEEHTEIERVVVNQVVTSVPPVRREGDVIVIPVCEEVLVTETRLVLREEVRVRKRQELTHKQYEVTLRREQVDVRPLEASDTPAAMKTGRDERE